MAQPGKSIEAGNNNFSFAMAGTASARGKLRSYIRSHAPVTPQHGRCMLKFIDESRITTIPLDLSLSVRTVASVTQLVGGFVSSIPTCRGYDLSYESLVDKFAEAPKYVKVDMDTLLDGLRWATEYME